ncbi:hypothetical protein EBZ37_07065, partial [bacterium]|nr:hypothetical protein [bacterium]
DKHKKTVLELKALDREHQRHSPEPGIDETSTPEPDGDTTIYIDEAGLYLLIFGSRLPRALAFKEWVVSDVLPTLRRRGNYALTQEPAPRSFPAVETLQLDATSFLDATKRHLYVVSTEAELANGRLKIGVAGDVTNRIAQLQTALNDALKLLVVVLHAEKLEPGVLKRLPRSGAGGVEWRAASVDQVKQAILEAYEELKAQGNLPTSSAPSLKRKREDAFETRQEMESQMQLERFQDERKIAMDKHQCEMDKHQCEMDRHKLEMETAKDKHALACERERLQIRQQAIEIRKQEIALGM